MPSVRNVKSSRSPKTEEKGLDKAAKIKIAVASVVLLVAFVMIANTAGWISLWGGERPLPPEPPMTPQQQEARQQEIKRAQEQVEIDAKRPGVIRAGE
jgi:hypothetical protein